MSRGFEAKTGTGADNDVCLSCERGGWEVGRDEELRVQKGFEEGEIGVMVEKVGEARHVEKS